jgi:16S rRNA (cytidine1402-2'-O)-methyltransferase
LAATLYLVSTPIGNLEDITLRALRILRDEVSWIACEDTRQTRKLLDHFEIRKPLASYHDHNEASRTPEILAALARGESVAVVSDAGTPLVSDPGYRVVEAAIEGGFPVVPIPGASAILSALSASGLPPDEFRFVGFLPPKSGARHKLFESLATEAATVIAYESPHRIVESVAELASLFPARPIVVARELTKLHEEFLRGRADQVSEQLKTRQSVKGEITLLIGRAVESGEVLDAASEVERLAAEGIDRMEAIKQVAKRMGVPKREVYRLSAERGNSSPGKSRD